MSTFITVDYEESQLLERNRRQVNANRLEALEAQEREKLSRQIKAAVDSQDEIVAGRLRRRQREELAATVILKPERHACLIEVSGGFMTGVSPMEALPAGYWVRIPGDPLPPRTPWEMAPNIPYMAEINPRAVESIKKEQYNQIGDLHFISTYTSGKVYPTEPVGVAENAFSKYYLLDLGKRKNGFQVGSTEYIKFAAIDLHIKELSDLDWNGSPGDAYAGSVSSYLYNWVGQISGNYRFRMELLDLFWIQPIGEWQYGGDDRVWWANRGPLSIDFPLTINLYPTKDAKAIDDAINGNGFESIIQVATQKNWKQTAVKNYNWSAATTNPPPASFPQTSFATVKANINKFEFLIT